MESNFPGMLSQARAYIVLKDAAFAPLLGQVIYSHNPDITWGRTDGRVVELGSKWMKAELPVQAALIIHEILHIAFRHIPMAKQWVDPFHYEIWNILNDAIINTIIEGAPHLKLPEEGVKDSDVLEPLGLQGPIERWSSLDLYREWLKVQGKSVNEFAKALQKAQEKGLLDLSMKDLPGGDKTNSEVKQEQELSEDIQAQLWKIRVENYTKNSESKLDRLAKFVPPTPYPWEKVVLSKAGKACQGEFERTYRATSIIQKTMPRYPVVLPSYRPQEKRAGVYIGVDVSGSIDDMLLNRMLGVSNDIQQKLKAEVCLIFFDSKIQQVYLTQDSVKADFEKGKIKITGGGGTNFQPIFEFIENEPPVVPHILFVLTDGFGSFPSKNPKYPVVWVLTEEVKVPFGSTVGLKVR